MLFGLLAFSQELCVCLPVNHLLQLSAVFSVTVCSRVMLLQENAAG